MSSSYAFYSVKLSKVFKFFLMTKYTWLSGAHKQKRHARFFVCVRREGFSTITCSVDLFCFYFASLIKTIKDFRIFTTALLELFPATKKSPKRFFLCAGKKFLSLQEQYRFHIALTSLRAINSTFSNPSRKASLCFGPKTKKNLQGSFLVRREGFEPS